MRIDVLGVLPKLYCLHCERILSWALEPDGLSWIGYCCNREYTLTVAAFVFSGRALSLEGGC